MRLSLAEVIRATGGRPVGGPSEVTFSSYHTDSRMVQAGGLFIALQGAEADGHTFCGDAIARGAAGLLVRGDSPPPAAGQSPPALPPLVDRAAGLTGVAVIQVEDTWKALYDLAGHVLRQVAPLVVGVTGSNGKTSTKEMTAAVLGRRHRVLKTEGNLNTETGLPLTLLRLERQHTAAVLEMGMQSPGEIARLAELSRPKVGIVTMVGTVHLEYFDSTEALARAKGELVAALPEDGLAVLNAEDGWFDLLRGMSRAPISSFGLTTGDLRAASYRARPEGGSVITVDGVQVVVGLDGRHQARNALAALTAGCYAGVPLVEAAGALADLRVEQRLETLRACAGYTLVDDSYNASPESMLAAFELLAGRPRSGRLLALLGEMRELGAIASAAHESIGRRARDVFEGIGVVDTGHGRLLADAARADLLPDLPAAVEWVKARARPGDVLLVKASHGVGLHQIVQTLLRAGKTDEDVQPSGDRSCH